MKTILSIALMLKKMEGEYVTIKTLKRKKKTLLFYSFYIIN